VDRLKEETAEAIKAIQSYEGEGQEAARDILVKQIAKLKHHDNIDTVVEGFVFQHDGQMYKFTGNFAPMNQLLGLFRYGRGKVPRMVKEALLEQNEADYSKETVAILPGKFKPAHRGHLDMIRHYLDHADRVVVLISPKEKDGITADIAERLLQMYVRDAGLTNVDIEIAQYPSPVQAAIEYGNNPEMEGTKIILGASTKGGDASERYAKNLQKYVEHAEVLNPLDYACCPLSDVISATDFRNALRNNEDIDHFLPAGSKDKAEIIADMIKEKLTEGTQHFLGIFRRLTEEVLKEVYSDKQRRWACAQSGESRKDFDDPSLSKDEAEEMCKSKELKEEEEELEETTVAGAVAGGAGSIGKPQSRERKTTEEEVNEALNYLLQKLGV
jgi:cytidyltransferase-like protein